jgi:hypothetical protein
LAKEEEEQRNAKGSGGGKPKAAGFKFNAINRMNA